MKGVAVPASRSRDDVRARRLGSPTLLAWATVFIGVISVVSAATPEMANRSDIVRGILPQGVPGVARTLTLAFGLGLLWLARGLAQLTPVTRGDSAEPGKRGTVDATSVGAGPNLRVRRPCLRRRDRHRHPHPPRLAGWRAPP